MSPGTPRPAQESGREKPRIRALPRDSLTPMLAFKPAGGTLRGLRTRVHRSRAGERMEQRATFRISRPCPRPRLDHASRSRRQTCAARPNTWGGDAGVNVSRSPARVQKRDGRRPETGVHPARSRAPGRPQGRGPGVEPRPWVIFGVRDSHVGPTTPNAMPTLRRASRRASEFVFTPSRGQLASARGCALSYPSRRRPLVRWV